jgi:hypothetical protein
MIRLSVIGINRTELQDAQHAFVQAKNPTLSSSIEDGH